MVRLLRYRRKENPRECSSLLAFLTKHHGNLHGDDSASVHRVRNRAENVPVSEIRRPQNRRGADVGLVKALIRAAGVGGVKPERVMNGT